MDFVKLTDEQRQFFDENGYLVVPEAIDAEHINRLTKASNRLIASFDRNGLYVQRRPGIVQEDDFIPLLTNSSTVPLVAQLLTPNIHLHTTAIIYKYPQPADDDAAKHRGWHRDAGITEDLEHRNLPRVGIKVGYCLTNFEEPNSGFTLFASGTHKIDGPLPIPKGKVDPPGTVELRLRAGDAFLFENRLFHTSAPNLSNRVSKVVIFGYAYRWLGGLKALMDQVQPGESVLQRADDIAKQLLGGQSSALVEWAKEHGVMPEVAPWVVEV